MAAITRLSIGALPACLRLVDALLDRAGEEAAHLRELRRILRARDSRERTTKYEGGNSKAKGESRKTEE